MKKLYPEKFFLYLGMRLDLVYSPNTQSLSQQNTHFCCFRVQKADMPQDFKNTKTSEKEKLERERESFQLERRR